MRINEAHGHSVDVHSDGYTSLVSPEAAESGFRELHFDVAHIK